MVHFGKDVSFVDKMVQGFIVGLAGGIMRNVFDVLFFHGLQVTKMRYLDHMAMLLYQQHPENLPEILFALGIDLWNTAFLGIVFFYLLEFLKVKNYLFAGFIYGSLLWIIFHFSGSVLHIPTFTSMKLETLFIHLILDSFYGVVLGYMYLRIFKAMDKQSNQ